MAVFRGRKLWRRSRVGADQDSRQPNPGALAGHGRTPDLLSAGRLSTVFFPDGQRPLAEVDTFQVPHLDHTWECITREGAQALYAGDLAIAFAKEIKAHGGYVTRDDLTSYRAILREPIMIPSRHFQLALNPPPSVGGTAAGFLIRLLDLGWRPDCAPARQALLHAQAQSCLLNVREDQLSYPHFDGSAAQTLLEATTLQKQFLTGLSSPNTTHLSVVTQDGTMVSVTLSMGYGAGVLILDTGIACNNSLGEPELNPQGYHVAETGSRLVSNMAPTIAWHQDGRCLAFGSPGASRITTSIAQTWARYALEGFSFEAAVAAPRLHVEASSNGLSAQCEPGIDTSLLSPRFIVRPFDQPDMYFGAIKLATRDERGRLSAAADARRQGSIDIV